MHLVDAPKSASSSAGFESLQRERRRSRDQDELERRSRASTTAHDLLAFFADRLKVQLREQGARHDLVDAVFALEGQDDLVLIVRRVEALGKFLDTDDGKNLLAGTKRAANILRIEEKKDNKAYTGAPDPKLLPAGRGTGARRSRSTRRRRMPPRPWPRRISPRR